jgi:hypothetical protein
MKKINYLFTLICLFISSYSFSQTLSYEDIVSGRVKKGEYTSYVAKDGSVFNVGDKITLGSPSGVNGRFVHLTKVDIAGTIYQVGPEAVNTSCEIKKIRLDGNERRGFKAAFRTKGFTGIDNYFLWIEDAIVAGEVKSLVMSSDEALSELKKAKDKLDLGLITQEEFNSIKTELSKYIK